MSEAKGKSLNFDENLNEIFLRKTIKFKKQAFDIGLHTF